MPAILDAIEEKRVAAEGRFDAVGDRIAEVVVDELVVVRPALPRVHRRLARPEVKKATEVAERLLSLREQHRLHGIERVPRSPVTA